VGAARRRPVGDRLEAALDHRSDVAGEIDRGQSQAPSRRGLVRTAVWLAITGVSLYLVAPALLDTLSSWRDLQELSPGWYAAMAALQAASMASLWWLQHIALHGASFFAVATSQLAGNGMAKAAPGGGAVGAALQYRMLVQAGAARPQVVSGLTASNLVTLAIVLGLPVLATPALIRGTVDRSLVEAAVAGLAVFALLFAAGAVMLVFDRPLAAVGRIVQRVRNRLRPRAEALRELPARLLRERDRIVATIGRRWKAALTAGIGRWAFDYASLVAALAAVGAHPRPALVLLAFCTAQLLAQVPVTPGGLGVVEAGLTATLTLAGVSAGDAVLATLAYRLLTYWIPMPLGVAATVLHRRRYARRPGSVPA
jgi:uncharacterized protein (TIRG00374 family)